MSDLRVGGGAYFDRGIDSITHTQGQAGASLPDKMALPPGEHLQRPQLDQLLALPNLESFLEAQTRPELANRDLLMPTRFNQVLGAVTQTIGEAAQHEQPDNPDAQKVLNRASRLLAEESGLRDLLQMYRSVLFQG